MYKVIIAFADVKNPKFDPTYAEFHVAEPVVEAYINHDDKSMINAARCLMGVRSDKVTVNGVFVDGAGIDNGYDIAKFFDELKQRWHNARKDVEAAARASATKQVASARGGSCGERPVIKVRSSEIPPELAAILGALASR